MLELSVAAVHAEEIGGKEGRLLATRAGADLKDGVLLVERIFGDEQHLELMLDLGKPRFEALDLLLGQSLDFGIVLVEQLPVLLNLLLGRTVLAEELHHVLQVGMGFGELLELLLIVIDAGLGQLLLQLHVFLLKAFEFGEHGNISSGACYCSR